MTSNERPLPPQCSVICPSGRCRHLSREGETKCSNHLKAEADFRLCTQCGAGRLRPDNQSGFCAMCRKRKGYQYVKHIIAQKVKAWEVAAREE